MHRAEHIDADNPRPISLRPLHTAFFQRIDKGRA